MFPIQWIVIQNWLIHNSKVIEVIYFAYLEQITEITPAQKKYKS